MFCSYYQAHVDRPRTWLVVATLRSFEHVAFDRTLAKEQSLFEFFVPCDQENLFLQIMELFAQRGLVTNLRKLPNRYQNTNEYNDSINA